MRVFRHVPLIYNRTGQVLSFFPPDAEVIAEGAPTSAATYSVWRGTASNDDTAEFSGTATLDSVATTFGSASGYSQTNRKTLNLASTASIVVGDRYLATTADTIGRREVVVPDSVTTSTVATAEEPLSYDYATGATFKGLRHYFTVDATFIANSEKINVWGGGSSGNPALSVGPATGPSSSPPYRVRWVYTTGSVTRESWTTFDVVRKPAKTLLSVQDLKAVAPDVQFWDFRNQLGQDFQPQLVRAESDFWDDCEEAGYDPDAIVDPQRYDNILLRKWIVYVGEARWLSSGRRPDWLDHARDEYKRKFQANIGTTLRARVDLGTTGAITATPPRQLWLRGR